MGVSIYYTAYRDQALTDQERARVGEIVAAENSTLLAELDRRLPAWRQDGVVPAEVSEGREICEGLGLYDQTEPGVILEGSSKISHGRCGPEPMYLQFEHYTRSSLGRLRNALPGAEWRVHVDDTDLTWHEATAEYR